jgi:ATP adenylyltransferase
MHQLWAPWRMTYIAQASDTVDEGCIFCSKPGIAPTKDEDQLILYRGKYGFIMMNLYPYNTGHLLIAPYKHIGSLASLAPDEIIEVTYLVQKCELALRTALKPDGFNVGINMGRVAGAGFPDHVHFHIVPRWDGDTNFMPVLADVKVMPEFMETTYHKIKTSLQTLL